MLNTFLIKHKVTNIIQGLNDLLIYNTRKVGEPLFKIVETNIRAVTLTEIHEAVREVTAGYRQQLQRLDDEIEALQMRREDMLVAAFEDGLQLTIDQLADFVGS